MSKEKTRKLNEDIEDAQTIQESADTSAQVEETILVPRNLYITLANFFIEKHRDPLTIYEVMKSIKM